MWNAYIFLCKFHVKFISQHEVLLITYLHSSNYIFIDLWSCLWDKCVELGLGLLNHRLYTDWICTPLIQKIINSHNKRVSSMHIHFGEHNFTQIYVLFMFQFYQPTTWWQYIRTSCCLLVIILVWILNSIQFYFCSVGLIFDSDLIIHRK